MLWSHEHRICKGSTLHSPCAISTIAYGWLHKIKSEAKSMPLKLCCCLLFSFMRPGKHATANRQLQEIKSKQQSYKDR